MPTPKYVDCIYCSVWNPDPLQCSSTDFLELIRCEIRHMEEREGTGLENRYIEAINLPKEKVVSF